MMNVDVKFTVVQLDLDGFKKAINQISPIVGNDGISLFMKKIKQHVEQSFENISNRTEYDHWVPMGGDGYRIRFRNFKNAYDFVHLFCNSVNKSNENVKREQLVFPIGAVTDNFNFDTSKHEDNIDQLTGESLAFLTILSKAKKGSFCVDKTTFDCIPKDEQDFFKKELVEYGDGLKEIWCRDMIPYNIQPTILSELLAPSMFDLKESMSKCITEIKKTRIKGFVIYYCGTMFRDNFEKRLEREVSRTKSLNQALLERKDISPVRFGELNVDNIQKTFITPYKARLSKNIYTLFSILIEEKKNCRSKKLLEDFWKGINDASIKLKNEEKEKLIIIFFVRQYKPKQSLQTQLNGCLTLQHFYFEEHHVDHWIDDMLKELEWNENSKKEWQKKICEISADKINNNQLSIDKVYSHINYCQNLLKEIANPMTRTQLEEQFISRVQEYDESTAC